MSLGTVHCPRSLRLLLLTLLAGLVLPAGASAASCPVVATTQPYVWAGDTGWYFVAPGGTFQPGTPAWTPTGGAGTAAEPWRRTGNVVANLPGASTLTSPTFCVDAYRPHLRFDVRALGRSGSLQIEAVRAGRPAVVLGTLVASDHQAWSLSPRVPLATALAIPAGVVQDVRLRLRASGTTWRVDDVAIDPYRK